MKKRTIRISYSEYHNLSITDNIIINEIFESMYRYNYSNYNNGVEAYLECFLVNEDDETDDKRYIVVYAYIFNVSEKIDNILDADKNEIHKLKHSADLFESEHYPYSGTSEDFRKIADKLNRYLKLKPKNNVKNNLTKKDIENVFNSNIIDDFLKHNVI